MGKQEKQTDKPKHRFTAPGEMNEYIQVVSPGAWLALLSLVLLLAAFCAWAIWGRLETKVPAAAVVENGQMTVYVLADGETKIQEGQKLQLEGETYEIRSVSEQPQVVDEKIPEYLRYVGDFELGDWVRTAEVAETAASTADGTYRAQIVTESISPVHFLWN